MASGEHAGDFDPAQQPFLPDPGGVARVVALRTGNQLMDPDAYNVGSRWLDISYQTASERIDSGTAVVQVRYIGYHDPTQPDKATDRKITEAPIGHFRPDLGVWTMYAEYLPADLDQTQNLMRYLEKVSTIRENAMFESRDSSHAPFLMLHHRDTMDMRRKTGALLQYPGLRENLLDRNPHVPGSQAIVGFDEATSAHMIISPRVNEKEFIHQLSAIQHINSPQLFDVPLIQTLSAVYQGAIIVQPDGTVIRGEHTMDLATQDQADANLWHPNSDLLSDQEWAALQTVPQDFVNAKLSNRSFLADQCAVGVNMHDSFVHPDVQQQ